MPEWRLRSGSNFVSASISAMSLSMMATCLVMASMSPPVSKPWLNQAALMCRGRVRDQIRDRLPLLLIDLGDQSVKNIARPVRVFSIQLLDELLDQAASNLPNRWFAAASVDRCPAFRQFERRP